MPFAIVFTIFPGSGKPWTSSFWTSLFTSFSCFSFSCYSVKILLLLGYDTPCGIEIPGDAGFSLDLTQLLDELFGLQEIPIEDEGYPVVLRRLL
jgi:hypothetical protein